jgi:outer membrane protein assembly factor BamB
MIDQSSVTADWNCIAEPVLRWTFKSPSPPNHALLLNDSSLLITTHRGELFGLNLHSGKRITRLWKPFKKPVEILAFDTRHGVLFLTSTVDKKVLAYQLTTADILWEIPLAHALPEMIIQDEWAVVPVLRRQLQLLDKHTGTLLSSQVLPGVLSSGLFQIDSSYWALLESGELLCFDQQLKLAGKYSIVCSPQSALGICGQIILIGDAEGRLYLFDSRSRKLLLRDRYKQPFYTAPLLSDALIIAAKADGQVMALDSCSTKVQWKFCEDGLINLPLQQCDGLVIIPYTKGVLVALDRRTGLLQWRKETERQLRWIMMTPRGILAADRSNKIYYWEIRNEA